MQRFMRQGGCIGSAFPPAVDGARITLMGAPLARRVAALAFLELHALFSFCEADDSRRTIGQTKMAKQKARRG